MSTSRTVRRAAERRARKLARKGLLNDNEIQTLTAPEPAAAAETEELELADDTQFELETGDDNAETPAPALMPAVEPHVSDARRAANRANAQRSTGPVTEQGKANSSKNALKTALTGRTVLLPGDDAERYAARLAEYERAYRPVGVRETEIVQALADAWWRLERIPGLIEALYVKGCNEFADKATDLDPQCRLTMLRMETYVAYEKQFRNLELQEGRLFRYAQKLKAELVELRKEREHQEAEALSQAAMLYLVAKKDRQPFDPAAHGFEFSTADIEGYLHGRRARQVMDQAVKSGEVTPVRSTKAAA